MVAQEFHTTLYLDESEDTLAEDERSLPQAPDEPATPDTIQPDHQPRPYLVGYKHWEIIVF